MDYHASDQNVTDYLEELRAMVATIGTNSYTGTANLKELCIVLKANVEAFALIVDDKAEMTTQRYNIVTKMIDSITNKYQGDALESRYLSYVTHKSQVTITSNFMNLVHLQMDSSFGADFRELGRLRRELQQLTVFQSVLSTYNTYISEITVELDNLISKCST